jgi:DME family drug/metabolite transporter
MSVLLRLVQPQWASVESRKLWWPHAASPDLGQPCGASAAYLVIGALSVAIYPLAFYGSMRLAGVTVGTVITIGSAPLLSALIEYILDRRNLTLRWSIGALVGLIGMVLICVAENASHGEVIGGDSVLSGVCLGLIGGLTYALYSWSARKMMLEGTRSSVAMGATFGLGGLLLMPVLIVSGGPFLASWTNAAVGLYMAAVPMFLGYISFGFGLARVQASMATVITLLEPVVAAVLAVLIVGERLPIIGWIGVALVVGCLAIITMPFPLGGRYGAKQVIEQPGMSA